MGREAVLMGCKRWQGSEVSHALRLYKQFYVILNVCNHFGILFDDVKQKLEYRMRLVYAHLPISANTIYGGKVFADW